MPRTSPGHRVEWDKNEDGWSSGSLLVDTGTIVCVDGGEPTPGTPVRYLTDTWLELHRDSEIRSGSDVVKSPSGRTGLLDTLCVDRFGGHGPDD